MKLKNPRLLSLQLAFTTFLIVQGAQAATVTSTSSGGAWNATATWSGGWYP